MNILHICGNYVGNKLFSEWFLDLAKYDLKQKIYVPIQSSNLMNKYFIEHINIDLEYSLIKNHTDRLLYFKKINKYYKDATIKKQFENIDCIHAHMLYSDGGVAYLANKNLNIPYIVAVRDTDVNLFLKYFPHTRNFIRKVLRNASKVIFLSPKYIDKVCEYLPEKEKKELQKKSKIIPNGLSEYWTNNLNQPKQFSDKINLIQVGAITHRKNAVTSVKVVKNLLDSGYDVRLNLVGEGKEMKKCKKIANELNIINRISFNGFIKTKNKLLNEYRESSIFIMPSLRETFGMSYIEAMSQGLPVIYSKNQGIDGYFEEGTVGFSVSSKNVKDISKKIMKIQENYSFISNNCIKETKLFKKEKINKEYLNIYQSSINNSY